MIFAQGCYKWERILGGRERERGHSHNPFLSRSKKNRATTLFLPLWGGKNLGRGHSRAVTISNSCVSPRARLGTRIIYDRSTLLNLRNSPLSRTPPAKLAYVAGVTGGSLPHQAGSHHRSHLNVETHGSSDSDSDSDSDDEKRKAIAKAQEEQDAKGKRDRERERESAMNVHWSADMKLGHIGIIFFLVFGDPCQLIHFSLSSPPFVPFRLNHTLIAHADASKEIRDGQQLFDMDME